MNIKAISKCVIHWMSLSRRLWIYLLRLSERHKGEKDSKSCFKLSQEIEKLGIEYSSAQNRAQEVLDTVLDKN